MPYKDPDKQRAYQVQHGRMRMRRKRREYVQLYGGKCIECGNNDERVLHFHHRDRSTKSPTYGSWTYSKEIVCKELDKCDLLCANCHAIKEWLYLYPE